MKIKEKFESIDQSKLSDSQKEILTKIKSATKDFTIEDEKSIEKVNGALDNIIDKLKKSNPEAIKEEPKKVVEVKEKKTRTKTQKTTPKGKTSKAKTPKEPKSGKRTVFSLAKEIRKSDESWEDAKSRAKKIMEQEKEGITQKMKSETEKLLAFIKRRKELEGLSGTTISKDAKIQALAKGRRVSKNGKIYYENRDNRTDRLAPSFEDKIYLADGGGVGKNYNNPKNATHVLQIDGQNWYLEKIDSTHFYMSNSPDFRGMANHIGQHRGEPYYNEIRQWLKDTFANGGFTPDVSDGTQFMDGGALKVEDNNYGGKNLLGYEPYFEEDVTVASFSEKDKIVRPSQGYFYPNPMAKRVIRWAKKNGYEFIQDGKKYANGGFTPDVSDGTQFMDGVYADGGFVSKGQMVWNKLTSSKRADFLKEYFTPEITPRSQEILVGKTYKFLPRNVKIKVEAIYANVEDYADGGAIIGIPETPLARGLDIDYTTLVGETGALSSGEMFENGGGMDSKLEVGVYRVGKPIKVSTNLYEQKIVEVFDNGDIATASDYGRSLSDFKSMQYPTISKEQLDSMYMYGGDFFKKGGALLSTRERYVAELKGLTGLRQNAIDNFIDENNLTNDEILNIVIGLGRKQITASDVSTAIVGTKDNAEFKKLMDFVKSDKALRAYKEGGRVVNIVNEGKDYSKKEYQGIFGDYDGDGITNVNDLNPLDKKKVGKVDNIEIDETFKKLIDLKNDLDVKMYEALEELDKKAPKNAEFYARTKTPFSIVKKLVDKRLLDPKKGLTDLIGTTVVVSDQKELEKVKKDLDNGLMGEVLDFDDFYEKPNNGYRAYHYIVQFKGTPIEVQLKTKMQKQLNEVSHEFYKKGTLNAKGLNEVSEMIMKADKGDKKALEEVKMLLSNEGELAKKISVESFAMGGGLDNHGLREGDQIIKTMSGGIQKVMTKSGDIVYVDLANGYRGAEPPLPFAKGGRLKSALMRDRNNFNHFEKHEIAYSKDKPKRKGYGYADGGMMNDDNQMPKLNLGKHKND